jgi:NO-binding membrane sensor protein with MHYT domain
VPRLQDEDFETLVAMAAAMTALICGFWVAFHLTHQHGPRPGEILMTAATGALDFGVLALTGRRIILARRAES